MASSKERAESPIIFDGVLNPQSYYDLNDEQSRLCDDLITKLGTANLSGDQPTNTTRQALWVLVFRNWNPNTFFRKPEPLSSRRKGDSSILVGRLHSDCPEPPRQKKSKHDGSYVLAEHRRAGADIWLKPNINWEEETMTFMWIDKANAAVNFKLIALHAHLTVEKAKLQAIRNFDQRELDRVGEWNEKLVVYWARVRLVCEQRRRKQNAGDGGQDRDIRVLDVGAMPEDATENRENANELRQIRLGKDILEHWATLATSLNEQMNSQDYFARSLGK